jgi:phytoene dehydrogenase-like protein
MSTVEQDSSALRPQALVDVIVAGAGHNGLVAACYLARAGLKVLVLEAHARAGGMTATNPMAPEAPDHLINEASIHASLFRMSPIEAELELATKFGLRQRIIDPCHVQLSAEGDESIGTWRDPRRMAQEISYFSPRDAKAYIEFAELIAAAIDIGLPLALTSATRPAPMVLLNVLRRRSRAADICANCSIAPRRTALCASTRVRRSISGYRSATEWRCSRAVPELFRVR